jgi:hypothetical protein
MDFISHLPEETFIFETAKKASETQKNTQEIPNVKKAT